MSYIRYFMPMTHEANGYGHKGRRPAGRSIVEERDGNCKLTVWVQDLQTASAYGVYLLFADGGRYAGVAMGSLTVDEKGKGELRREFTPQELDRFRLTDIVGVVVLAKDTAGVVSPLCGYKGEAVVWRHLFYEYSRAVVAYRCEDAVVAEEEVPVLDEEPAREEEVLVLDEEPALEEEVPVLDEEPAREEEVPALDEEPAREEEVPVVDEEPALEEEVLVPNEDRAPVEEVQAPDEDPAPEEEVPVPDEEAAPMEEAPFPIEEPAPAEEVPVPIEEPAPADEVPVPIEEPAPAEEVPAPIEESTPLVDEATYNDKVGSSHSGECSAFHSSAPPKTLHTLESKLSSKDPITPFKTQSRRTNWVRFNLADNIPPPVNKPRLFEEPFILAAHATYDHLIYGITADKGPRRHIIGVPGKLDQDARHYARRLGFTQFKPCDGTSSGSGLGYWLMFITV